MGDENGPPPPALESVELRDELMLAPAAERSFDRRDGGMTMSRKAFWDVVSGWPPESSVSSRSCWVAGRWAGQRGKGEGLRTW
jgi:hypothetical protein